VSHRIRRARILDLRDVGTEFQPETGRVGDGVGRGRVLEALSARIGPHDDAEVVFAGGLLCLAELLDHLDLVVGAAVDGEADGLRADLGGVLDGPVDRRVRLAHPEVRRAVEFGEQRHVVLVGWVVPLGDPLLDRHRRDGVVGADLEDAVGIGRCGVRFEVNRPVFETVVVRQNQGLVVPCDCGISTRDHRLFHR